MNKLSSGFGGASSGASLASNLVRIACHALSYHCCSSILFDDTSDIVSLLQSPMTIPQIAVEGLMINPDIMDLDTAESAFENFTSL